MTRESTEVFGDDDKKFDIRKFLEQLYKDFDYDNKKLLENYRNINNLQDIDDVSGISFDSPDQNLNDYKGLNTSIITYQTDNTYDYDSFLQNLEDSIKSQQNNGEIHKVEPSDNVYKINDGTLTQKTNANGKIKFDMIGTFNACPIRVSRDGAPGCHDEIYIIDGEVAKVILHNQGTSNLDMDWLKGLKLKQEVDIKIAVEAAVAKETELTHHELKKQSVIESAAVKHVATEAEAVVTGAYEKKQPQQHTAQEQKNNSKIRKYSKEDREVFDYIKGKGRLTGVNQVLSDDQKKEILYKFIEKDIAQEVIGLMKQNPDNKAIILEGLLTEFDKKIAKEESKELGKRLLANGIVSPKDSDRSTSSPATGSVKSIAARFENKIKRGGPD